MMQLVRMLVTTTSTAIKNVNRFMKSASCLLNSTTLYHRKKDLSIENRTRVLATRVRWGEAFALQIIDLFPELKIHVKGLGFAAFDARDEIGFVQNGRLQSHTAQLGFSACDVIVGARKAEQMIIFG